MAVSITYFVHATTTDNELGIATGWLPGQLSQRGYAQAFGLGAMLSKRQFDGLYCSDLQRATETAALAFIGRYEALPDARLRECNNGEWNGTPANALKERLAGFIETPFPGGESLRDVERRVASFLEDLRERHEDQQIAIVAHQAPQLALEVLLNGRTCQKAIEEDWRRRGAWQAGWYYRIA